MKYSVCGVFFKDKKILLNKRDNLGKMAKRWELAGGKVEQGETYKDALVREFFEELKVKIKVEKYLNYTFFKNKNELTKLLAYKIDILDDVKKENLVEHTDFRYFSKLEIKKLNLVDSDRNVLNKIFKII